MIFDAALSDILTNQQLSFARDFYGGMNVLRVRYVGFPTPYKPEVGGFEFERLANRLSQRRGFKAHHRFWGNVA
jgi:hypothetical protein